MCDPYVKESFLTLTAIPQSSHRDIQPCIVPHSVFAHTVIHQLVLLVALHTHSMCGEHFHRAGVGN